MKLRECPFCGGRNIFVGTIAEIRMIEKDHPDYWNESTYFQVVCDWTEGGCGASSGGGIHTKEQAIEAWNRRVGDDLTERMVDDGK